MTSVTAISHPTIFKAFREIDYDNGAVTRFEPVKEIDEIPAAWEERLSEIESVLSTLSQEELETFCTGEEGEIEALSARSPAHRKANHFLNSYFEEWTDDEDVDGPTGTGDDNLPDAFVNAARVFLRQKAQYRCPKCKSMELEVVVEVWAALIQTVNGGDVEIETDTDSPDDGNHTWDQNSTMQCVDCGEQGIAEEFEVKN